MNEKKFINIKLIDFIPAISGLIGKIALASSFAFVWAMELGITNKSFVFENVRIEILVGSLFTLVSAFVFPKSSPPGTLAPLIVLVPVMAQFGVHPLILGVSIGIMGIIAVKTGVLAKLTTISGPVSRNSLTLAFGVSGIFLAVEKLYSFFQQKSPSFITLVILLSIVYIILFNLKKTYLIIPIAAVISIIIPAVFRLDSDISYTKSELKLSPSYWWNDLWEIGYGLDLRTILTTLPFAVFVIFLWTIDTVSIQVLQENSYQDGDQKQEIDINQSFITVAIRNMTGALFGGAQTSSLWRSFLIPLFMIKRPMRTCAILMGLMGIAFSITSLPISILSYSPLVWSVLLFGIFVPFVVASVINILKSDKHGTKSAMILLSLPGIFINPMITWISSLIYERVIVPKLFLQKNSAVDLPAQRK